MLQRDCIECERFSLFLVSLRRQHPAFDSKKRAIYDTLAIRGFKPSRAKRLYDLVPVFISSIFSPDRREAIEIATRKPAVSQATGTARRS